MPKPEDVERFVRWRDGLGIKPVCPFCGSKDWALGGPLALGVIEPGEIQAGSRQAPMTPLLCEKCGYVALFASALSGTAGE